MYGRDDPSGRLNLKYMCPLPKIQKFKNGKNCSNAFRSRNRKIWSRIAGSSLGGGATRSWAWSSMYSAAVSGLPSIGDRAAVIISVRKISSGISSAGGKDNAGFKPLLPVAIAILVIIAIAVRRVLCTKALRAGYAKA